MLSAGAAKTLQRIIGHIIATLHRNLLDRIRHVLDGDPEKAIGNLFSAAGNAGCRRDLIGKAGKFLPDHNRIEPQNNSNMAANGCSAKDPSMTKRNRIPMR